MKNKILLIDEGLSENQTFLEKLQKNYEVKISEQNGETALKMIREEKPDLLVMDTVLSQIDGYELLEKLRYENLTTKIIICSAISQGAFVEKAMSLGVMYYMLKPINLELLEKRINDPVLYRLLRYSE